jgi:signal transduction histidine kinase/ActR/RegA family two-component response regulator
MRSRSIRWHLFQVLLVSIFPVGLFAAGLLYLHWQAQEHERERSQIQSVRLLAAAVDNALDSTVQRMTIFAGLWAANPASDALIHAQARNALAANPDWANLLAFRADGTAVFRANEPFGTAMPEMKLVPQWQEVIIQRRPMVSDVFVSPDQGAKVVSVGVPVMRNNQVTHVLVARLNLRWFDELVTRQGRGGVAGIFDRNWKFVARGAEGEERRGTDPSQPLIEDIKRNPEGIGKYTALNGTAVYTSWTASRHGWWVAFATPSEPVESAFWRYLGLLGALWAALLAAGVAYAVSKGRHIAGALESVKARASELAATRAPSGPPRALPASRVDEVSEALEALDHASQTLQAAMRARDQSLETEQKARAAAEAANRAKDEFLAMLGHELRNPLAAIWSAVAVVRSDRHTREQLDFAAGVIERQSRHLKRLIDDLLDVGRVMTGKVMLERAPLDLAAAARYVVATLESAGRFTQRRLDVDTEPAWVDADHTRLEQIITNLLANAVTYSAAGGRVKVRVARRGDAAVLEVSDDGRGIAPEHLERVFDLFFQADSTVDRASGGLGIGLTLVQRLVGMHGGTISARSAGPGHGATFEVRLPAVEAGTQPALAAAPPRAAAVAHEILLVEDNKDERDTLRVALELEGHRVLHAADGVAALELLLRHRPRVAILDIGLPGMDGYQLARQARAAIGPNLRLIALTGYGGTLEVERAKQAGFDLHLTKPVDVRELLQAIEITGPVRAVPIGRASRGP